MDVQLGHPEVFSLCGYAAKIMCEACQQVFILELFRESTAKRLKIHYPTVHFCIYQLAITHKKAVL